MKTSFQRILGINLAIVLGLALVLRLLNRGRESEIGFLLLMAIAIAVQLLANIGLAFSASDKSQRQAHWLSVLLVLLVGFGTCAAGASITL